MCKSNHFYRRAVTFVVTRKVKLSAFDCRFSIISSTFALVFCTRSLKDRITDSGSVGLGSIPNGCTPLSYLYFRAKGYL